MNIIWDITVGNIITICGGLIATVMLWQKLNDRMDTTVKQTEKNTEQLERISEMALNTTIQQHERRLLELESVARNLSIATASIQKDIGWIRRALAELTGAKDEERIE